MTFSEKNCNTCGQKCAIKYHGCSNWIPTSDGELLIHISVLDKIRAEIEQLHHHPILDFINTDKVVDMAIKIIDKYRESEG